MEERSDRLDVQVNVGDRVVQVRVAGEVDIATVGAFRSVLWSAPARPVLYLELSGLRLLSAAGVRTLLAAHLRVRARGGELVLVDPTPVVARVLRATGLHRVMTVLEPGRVVEAAPPPGRTGRRPDAGRLTTAPTPT
ncbi:STAS domain-containing protein [Micromonospora sp. STR1_7]|uniref:Anti-sigma factor antagonist n=1 Tax=Micromonospora parastrephiae TaxID=2806101 RepID=A0ABS1Y1K0_9ACTN|nr:STAS domain-containing protein [Micromonospora parastrephiae]MBM0235391.1 STAS domain-containing protein [Micromonospora parastrephiae]